MKKISILFLLFSLIIIFVSPAQIYAQAAIIPTWKPQIQADLSILSRFKYYYGFVLPSGQTPKVAEVPLKDATIPDNPIFTLVEQQTNTLQPYEIITKEKSTPYQVISISGNNNVTNEERLYDGNPSTYTEFPVSENNIISTIDLRLNYNSPITTRSIKFQLDPSSKPPTNISLITYDNGREYTVIADKPFSESDLQFPVRTAALWKLTFKFTQPLRVTEISFNEDSSSQTNEKYLRFLMRPGVYYLYSQPDGNISLPYLEPGNLSTAQDTITLALANANPNPLYKTPDDDKDGILNAADNCPSTSNPDQIDKDKNGIGDACEDFDNDGVMNNIDNCPNHPNRDQHDTDGDSKGDQCDEEESRLTERLAFLPWLGIGLGFGVVIILFAITTKKHPTTPKQDNTNTKKDY